MTSVSQPPESAAPMPRPAPPPDPAEANVGAADRVFFRRLLAVALALAALIVFLGIDFLRSDQAAAREAILRELDAVADLKTEQIRQWRDDRLGEARFLQLTPAVAADVAVLVGQPGEPAARARLLGWLAVLRSGGQYESLQIFDPQARLLLSAPESADLPAHLPRETFAAVLAGRDAVIDDLHRGSRDGPIDLDILVPVAPPSAATDGGERVGGAPAPSPIGVIVLRLNASKFLFPMLRRWPTPSSTAEILLVRRDDDDVVFLNDLRHQADAALTLRRPLAERTLPAAMAVRGEPGVREGRDYRGVAVVVAARAIANSPWTLVAKIDQAEAFAPMRQTAWRNGALVLMRLLVVALVTTLIWRQRHSTSLRRALAVEHERNLLAERLAVVSQHANDSILLFDDRMRILEANERALAAYGRTLDEMRQLTERDLRVASLAAGVEKDFTVALTTAGMVFETEHRRKDGTTFPVEVSARMVELEGRRQVLAIVRDITERKRVEAEIQRSAAALTMAQRIGQIGNWEFDFETRKLSWSREIFRIFEIDPAKFGASYEAFLEAIHPEDRTMVHGAYTRSLDSHQPYAITHRLLLPGGRIKHVQESGETRYDLSGRPLRTIGTVQDITEAKQTEAELIESRQMLRLILDTIPVRVFWKDAESRYLGCNQPFATDAGLNSPAEIVGKDDWELGWLGESAAFQADDRFVISTGKPKLNYEESYTASSGHRIWVSTSKVPLRDATGRIIGILGSYENITSRRQAEQALRDSLVEKEVLLKEVHHRVKNNLQVILSLLRLETSRIDHPVTQTVMREMQGRIRAMALLHESLYRSGNFACVDLAGYLRQLATQLFRAHNVSGRNIKLTLELVPTSLVMEQAIPCGLLVNELLSNALKHGFPGQEIGEIRIELRPVPDGPQLRLHVADTGIGLPADFEVRRTKSLGLQLVTDLVRQLQGTLTIGAGPGAAFEVMFSPTRVAAAPADATEKIAINATPAPGNQEA